MTEWKIRDAWKWGLLEGGPEFISVGDCQLIEVKAELAWKVPIELVHAELNKAAWRCAALAFSEKGATPADFKKLTSAIDKFIQATKGLPYPLNQIAPDIHSRIGAPPELKRGPRVKWRRRGVGQLILHSYELCTQRRPAAGPAGPTARFIRELHAAVTPALNYPVWGSASDATAVREVWGFLSTNVASSSDISSLDDWISEYPPN